VTTDDQMKALLAEVDALTAERDALRAALEACEVSMDTAVVSGVGSLLAPTYRDSWKAAHIEARRLLAKSEAVSGT
jgi:hypothetical protein